MSSTKYKPKQIANIITSFIWRLGSVLAQKEKMDHCAYNSQWLHLSKEKMDWTTLEQWQPVQDKK